MTGPGIEVVSFDALGTLISLDPPGERLRSALATQGIDVPIDRCDAAMAAEIAHYRANHVEAGREGLAALEKDCAGVMRRHLDEPLTDAQALACLRASISYHLRPEARAALLAARTDGRRTAVASNWSGDLATILDDLGIGDLLDVVVTSSEAGAAKPSREFFDHLAARCATPLDRIAHVGDDPVADVAGPRAAGLAGSQLVDPVDPQGLLNAVRAVIDPGPERAAERPSASLHPALALIPLVAQLVTLALVVAGFAAFGWERPAGLSALYSPVLGLAGLASYVALIATTITLARRAGPAREVLRLRRRPIGQTAGLAFVGLIVSIVASRVLEPIFHGVASQNLTPERFPGGAEATIGLAITIVVFCVIGPVGEELFFRGFVMRTLDRWGPWVSVIGSAALFAAVHFQPRALPVLLVLGIVLGYLVVRTGSLAAGIVLHCVNNSLAVAAALLAG